MARRAELRVYVTGLASFGTQLPDLYPVNQLPVRRMGLLFAVTRLAGLPGMAGATVFRAFGGKPFRMDLHPFVPRAVDTLLRVAGCAEVRTRAEQSTFLRLTLERVLTVRSTMETARTLGVSKSAAYRWAKEGKISDTLAGRLISQEIPNYQNEPVGNAVIVLPMAPLMLYSALTATGRDAGNLI